MTKLKELICNKQTVKVCRSENDSYKNKKLNKNCTTLDISMVVNPTEKATERLESVATNNTSPKDNTSTTNTPKESCISPYQNRQYRSATIPSRISTTPIHLHKLKATPNAAAIRLKAEEDINEFYSNIAKAEEKISQQIEEQSVQFREKLAKTLWMKVNTKNNNIESSDKLYHAFIADEKTWFNYGSGSSFVS